MSIKDKAPKENSAAPAEPPPLPAAVAEPPAGGATPQPGKHQRRMEEAERTCSDALRQAFDEARRSAVHSYGEYLHQLQDAQIAAQKRSLEAYRAYLKAADENAESPEALLDEQVRYGRALETAWGPEGLAPAYEKAHKDYAKALQETDGRTRQRIERTYRDYLRALRDAATDLDVEAADPDTTAALGYRLLAAAEMGRSFGTGAAESLG